MVYAVWILAFVALSEGHANHNSKDEAVRNASNAVYSSTHRLKAALKNQKQVASEYRDALRNDTRADRMVSNVVAQTLKDATNVTQKKQAMKDYAIALSELKGASGNWHDAEKAALRKSKELENLDVANEHAAKSKLRSSRHKEDKKVRESYRETMSAAKSLHRDAKLLQHARYRAHEEESKVERESQENEDLIEGSQDDAEDQRDEAADAVQQIFERAEDRLLDQTQGERQAEAHKRRKAVEEVSRTLRAEARQEKSRSSSQLSETIDLMEQPMQLYEKNQTTVQEAYHAVAADKESTKKALKRMAEVAKEYRDANNNKTHAEHFSQLLAEKTQKQASDEKMEEKNQTMNSFTDVLYSLKQATPTGDWKELEEKARKSSDKYDKILRQEERDARQMLHEKGRDQKKEARRAYHKTQEAVEKTRKDRKALREARRHAGEEHKYTQETKENEHFVEQASRDAGRQKDEAQSAVDHVMNLAEHHLQYLQRRDSHKREVARADRERQIDEVVATFTKAQEQAQKSQHRSLFDVESSYMTTSLFAIASLGFLALFAKRITKRPIAAAQRPLLG